MSGGKNKATIVAFAMIFCILLQTNISNAATFRVGGANGWGFHLNGWPNGKTFKTGDVIEFKYPAIVHDVVEVGKESFDSCSGVGGPVFLSGDDKITLPQGTSYFLSSIGQDCAKGVKVAVTAN